MYIMSEKIILNNWKTQMSAYEWRKNLRSQNQNVGNLLDNIIFTKAYKLNYSGSGNTGGITPKQSK